MRADFTTGERFCRSAKAIRLIFIGVHAAKFLTVCVVNGHQKMVMFAPLVFAKISFLSLWGFFCGSFGHRGHPCLVW